MSSSSSESLRLSNCARFFFSCDTEEEGHLKLPTILTHPDLLKVVRKELFPGLQRNTGLDRKLRFNLSPRLILPLPHRRVNVTVTHSGGKIAHVGIAVVVYSVLDELLRRGEQVAL